MSTLLYGLQRAPVPADEANVRSTVTTVQLDAPSSVQPDAPDFNETRVDPVTEGGITPHQLASAVTDRVKTAPGPSNVNAGAALFGTVNDSISTSGTAAAREAAGERGHGSLFITEGIEPVIRDGNKFAEDYFSAGDRPIQDTAVPYMTPANPADPQTRADAAATGDANSRKAVAASMYSAYYNAVTG